MVNRHDLSPDQKAALCALAEASTRKGLTQVAIVLAMFGGGAWLSLNNEHTIIKLAAVLIIAAAMIRSGFLVHEASHRTLVRGKRLNILCGVLCGIPVGMPVAIYGYFHRIHHAYERTERDPGNLEFLAARVHLHPTIVQWIMLLVGTQLSIAQSTLTALKLIVVKRRTDMLFEYVFVALFFAGMVATLTGEQFLYLWVYPFLLGAQIMNVRIIAEHELPNSLESQFTRTRTIVSNKLVSWVFFNGNYHLEHHLYPKVPASNLPEVHRILQPVYNVAGSSVYTGYCRFMADYFRKSYRRFRSNDQSATALTKR